MSMLAERKRKQKWSLNPRGKDWSQDANKFGQKMLEKMGWQQGKGLGPKGDGMVEHVKVAYKNDSKGMGFKDCNDQWTKHETNFSALLESLSGKVEKPDEVKVKSLEKKSQSSRARVHYHKFTRGKDLSRYSEKDLANIFGKRSLKEEPKNAKIEISDKEESAIENGSSFLYNGGSMKDYFKSKLSKFNSPNGYVIGNDGVLKKDESDSESEIRPSFGFGFKSDSGNSNAASFVSYLSDSVTKRKADIEDLEHNIFSPKKKLKKGKENKSAVSGLINPALEPVQVKKYVLEPIDETFSEDTFISTEYNVITTKVDVHHENSIISGNKSESPQKNKKKMKFNRDSSESILDNSDNLESIDNTVVIGCESIESVNQDLQTKISKKSKKNKKSKEVPVEVECMSSMQFENPTFVDCLNEFSCDLQLDENPFEVKPKHKKKKKKDKAPQFDNPTFELADAPNDFPRTAQNPYEVKATKKRKQIYENPTFCDNINDSLSLTESSQTGENPYEVKVTKNRKKAYENPTFVDNHDNSTSSMSEDNPYEVKPKSKKKKKDKGTTNTDSNSILETSNDTICLENDKIKNKKKNMLQEDSTEEENCPELKTKKRKREEITGIPNPALNLSDNSISNANDTIEECDLMLNVVSTPVIAQTPTCNSTTVKKAILKRRKSVRFSDVTQEHIIPNNDDIRRMSSVDFMEEEEGIDNVGFDKQKTELDEKIETLSKDIESCQAEIENDINENKIKSVKMEDLMIGEVGNPHGEDELMPDGHTKLKFKNANFSAHTPFYHTDKVGAKKSYKHLIKGDIIVKFKNSNLHEIDGYANKKKKKNVT